MKVTVTQGIRVCHDGAVRHGGQSLDVPEDVAQQWIAWGWVGATKGDARLPDARGLTAGQLPTILPSDRAAADTDDASKDGDSEPADDQPKPDIPATSQRARTKVRRDPRPKASRSNDAH